MLLLAATLLGLAPTAIRTHQGVQDASAPVPEPPVAARVGSLEVTVAELRRVMADRWALSEDGRSTLRHVAQVLLIDHLAGERGVAASEDEVAARWRELDRESRANGSEGGIEGELLREGVDPARVRALIATSIGHERLTRLDLGLPDGAPVSGEQQQIWADEQLVRNGYQVLARPWADGVVAECGPVSVDEHAFFEALIEKLPREKIEELCYQLLLRKGVEARLDKRMPDLSDDARRRAIDAEIDRRRREVAADPTYQGLSFDTVLEAQGTRLESLPDDPAVVVAAFSNLWVERRYGEEGLRGVYETERQRFEDRYGPAVRTRWIVLTAVRAKNPLVTRTVDEAMATFERWKPKIKSEESFMRYASEGSEHGGTRESGGDLGFVARGESGVPEAVREALFAAADAGIPSEGIVIGPLALDAPSVVVLLWAGGVRPSPPWEVMRQHVHRELRARFMDEVVRRRDVWTFLDR